MARSIRAAVWTIGVAAACLALLAAASGIASAAGTTWYVTTATDDASDGSLTTHSGSLRFALTHATSGDLVSFAQYDAGEIRAASTLTVPAGVAVGRERNGPCGSATTPLADVRAANYSVNPVFSLSAGSTLRNIDVGAGYISARITGADVDVCGVGLGILSGDEANTLPPASAALIIDGERAVVHRSVFSSFLVVGIHGSDSRIGDTLVGSGDENQGVCSNRGLCGVTVYADSAGAGQRVTIRDAFPRGLAGMPGTGVLGGDDVITHANNWAQTPVILAAFSSDNFASVVVTGTANPRSVVDLFFDNQISLTRQLPVTAGDSGLFTYTGALAGHPVRVIAISTLNDPGHPNRAGSSSQFSDALLVTPPQPLPALEASAVVTGLYGLPDGTAHPGDVLRFTITVSNTGLAVVQRIAGSNLSLPAGMAVITGSGTMHGGSGFVATDAGFSGGALAAGEVATYSLDAIVTPSAAAGSASFEARVAADGVPPQMVSASIEVSANPGPSPRWFVWLPAILR